MEETLIGRAYQQQRFAESDVRQSWRMTRNILTCWKQACFVLAWFVGVRVNSPQGAWVNGLDTAQRSTALHATRLHVIDVTQMSLTKMLTTWLAKASGSCQTRRSPAIKHGVSDGIRTRDIQDHNLAL